MKTLLTTAATAAALALLSAPALAQDGDCGDVTIAEMNWASAGVLAQIDRIILEEGYGCDVSLVPGDTMPTFTSMNEKGEPDVAPEFWELAVSDPLNAAVEEGRLVKAAAPLSDTVQGNALEGWWVPQFVLDENPDIKTVEDALARPDLFQHPEQPGVGGIHNCPAGWNCRISTENLARAYGAEEAGFELVEVGSAAGLDGSIARAFERNEPWLGYYWEPTSIMGKYDLVRLDWGVEHDREEWNNCTTVEGCENPQKNAYPVAEISTVVTNDFAEQNAVAMDYLQNRAWSNEIVNDVLKWQQDNQANNEDAAYYFLENYGDTWRSWVSEDVASKIDV